jgi:hypothetical protein
MKSHWIMHQGKRVFMSDLSNYAASAIAIREECDAIKAILLGEQPRSVRAIVNVEGTFVNDEILREFRQIIPVTNKYVKRRAIIGLNGFRKNFLFLFTKITGNANFSHFENLNEALDWVVQD